MNQLRQSMIMRIRRRPELAPRAGSRSQACDASA